MHHTIQQGLQVEPLDARRLIFLRLQAITLNTLDAKAAPDTSAAGWLLALLVGVVVSGLGLTRKAVRR